jgi:TonB family protein
MPGNQPAYLTEDFMLSLRSLLTIALMSSVAAVIAGPARAQGTPAPVGIFEGHSDVGTLLHAGSVDYDASKRTYTIGGSGENMWFAADAFQFVWKKISGDVTLTADISFLTTTGNEHKKAALMLRQSLDADSVYADVALHASGLTSLQFRDEKGAITREIQSNISAPKRLRIAKRGDYIYMSLAADDGEPRVAGGWLRIPLQGEFYVGLGVCSHDKDVVEKAAFSNVELTQPAAAASGKPTLYSTLETVAIDSADRRVVYLAPGRFEAPNWMKDGSAFLFNRDGHIERLALNSDKPITIDTGFANRCNNDHGISPDATQIAISDNSQGDHNSRVYLVPIAGGAPRRITEKSPSYWHGWSPDGKTLAFVGQRNGDFDIYAIPAAGGDETRLTTAKGLDDGPEYSPDGKYIYFNSERTGHMQIWRMKPDASEQEQVFSDDLNNWFPHISPDGQWMVFLTYGADVTDHPENKDVMLRLMSLSDSNAKDKKITVLAKLFGGQGTINVPSWSPDSKQVAFVSYMLIPSENTGADVAARGQSTNMRPSVAVRHFVAPAYPLVAWLARIEGTVVIDVTVKAEGAVHSVKFISAHPVFREAVETAMKQWSFLPASTTTDERVTIRFQFEGDCPLTGSDEPSKAYYVQTWISADLPSNIEVATCLPITATRASHP